MELTAQERQVLDDLGQLVDEHWNCPEPNCAECQFLKRVAGGLIKVIFRDSFYPVAIKARGAGG